jgi:integrase
LVLNRYWTQHSDKRRNPVLPRTAGRYLLEFLGADARVGDLTKARQLEFLNLLHGSGLSVGYIARLMTSVQAALNFAVDREDDGSGLLTKAPRLIYRPKMVAEALNAPEPEPRNWYPDLAMVAQWLDGLCEFEEHLRRWTILIIGFGGCRAEAAREAGPFQLDTRHHTIRLNPEGRRQTKKFRPIVPVPDVLWPVLQQWSAKERFVGEVGVRYPGDQWIAARTRIGLPKLFTPRSIRHMIATELRHAHKRYGVARVSSDEIEMLMGHRRGGMNSLYGTFEPDYLEAAKEAVNAILIALNGECTRPFLPGTRPKLRSVK